MEKNYINWDISPSLYQLLNQKTSKNSYISQILVKISLNIAAFSYFSIPKKKNGINIAY